MKKQFLVISLFSLLTICNMHAYFGFGFSFGGRPAPVVAPVVPVAHVGFGVPISDCGPNVGFGFTVPLVARQEVCLDDADCSYWKIYNDTDLPVRVTNRGGDTKVIQPGQVRKLSHARSLRLKVRADGIERIVRTNSHRLSIRFGQDDAICIDAA